MVNARTHMPSGNINTVTFEINLYGFLNTAEIEKHINLTYMLSGNLNTCTINKYTNTLSEDNQTVAIW